jgi:hypothetical protein
VPYSLSAATPLPFAEQDAQDAQKLRDCVGFKSFCFIKVLKMLKVLK